MTTTTSPDLTSDFMVLTMSGNSGMYFPLIALAISVPEKSPGSVSRLGKILEIIISLASLSDAGSSGAKLFSFFIDQPLQQIFNFHRIINKFEHNFPFV